MKETYPTVSGYLTDITKFIDYHPIIFWMLVIFIVTAMLTKESE